MDVVIIRPAMKSDARAILDLVVEGKINPTGLDWERFIVAEYKSGEVVGCGQIKPHRDGSKELASIAVTEKWRGKGVARKVIEALLENQTGRLYLMCGSKLGSFYEKFGFRALDKHEMPKYFRRISQITSLVSPLIADGQFLLIMGKLD